MRGGKASTMPNAKPATPAVADPVEVLAANHFGAIAVEVHANLEPGATV